MSSDNSNKILRVDDSVQSKITNIGTIFKFIIMNLILGGIAVVAEQKITSPNDMSKETLILSTCFTFVGAYLYFTIIFFYEDITNNTIYYLIVINTCVIVTTVFTLLPQNKNRWKLQTLPDGSTKNVMYQIRETDPELIFLIVILLIPIILFSIFIVIKRYFPN